MKNLRKILAVVIGILMNSQAQAVHSEQNFTENGSKVQNNTSIPKEKNVQYYRKKNLFYEKKARKAQKKANSICIEKGTPFSSKENEGIIMLATFSFILNLVVIGGLIVSYSDIMKRMEKNEQLLTKISTDLKS